MNDCWFARSICFRRRRQSTNFSLIERTSDHTAGLESEIGPSSCTATRTATAASTWLPAVDLMCISEGQQLFKMNTSAPRSDVVTVRLQLDLTLTHSMAYVHR